MAAQNYLLVGDPFLTEKKFQILLGNIRQKVPGEVPSQSFRLSETSLDFILTNACTLPFLAEAQVFRILDAENLKSKDTETLEAYLSNPAPKTTLCFVSASSNPVRDLSKLINNGGEVFILDEKRKRNVASNFIREKLRNFGKTMDSRAQLRLEEMTADMPVFLDSLLEQLMTYAGNRQKITEEMVELFEEKWKEIDVFKIASALSSRQTGKGLMALREFTNDRERGLPALLGMLHWKVRQLWRARVLLDQGENEQSIMRQCRISPRQAPYFMRELKGFSRPKLEKIIETLFELDWKLKTGRIQGPMGVESWLVQATT